MPRKKSIDRENSELLSPTASTAGQCALGRITVFEKIDQGFLVPRIPLALILVSHKSVKDRVLVTAKFWQQCHALIGVLVRGSGNSLAFLDVAYFVTFLTPPYFAAHSSRGIRRRYLESR